MLILIIVTFFVETCKIKNVVERNMTNIHSRFTKPTTTNIKLTTVKGTPIKHCKVRAFRMQEEYGPKKFIKP